MEQVLEFIITQWLFDMSVFSMSWLYWPLLIPFFCYFIFFACKWAVITLPVWLPLRLIFCSINTGSKSFNSGDKKNDSV